MLWQMPSLSFRTAPLPSITTFSFSQLLHGVLSALLDNAKVFAAEQARADKSKIIENINGRKDVEELIERNVHRVQSPRESAPRGRGGHGDGVGEVGVTVTPTSS